jgi:predicted dehydrogenase
VISEADLHELVHPVTPAPATSHGVGLVGAGWIARECHLPAYASAGMQVVGIASRTPSNALALASRFSIPRVHDDWRSLLEDPAVTILDIAFPPDAQLEVVRQAVRHRDHIRGILAQKPLATTLPDAVEIVGLCNDAGIVLAVNQNMRYDPSIRALKRLLEAGCLGEPVIAQITMHARVGWMEYARDYPRKAMLIMSVHHLDTFRFLFGDPARVLASVRAAPGAPVSAADELAGYIVEYPTDFRAVAIDNCFSWADMGIEWRVDGTDGIAKGTIGWPDHPWGSPSTLDFTTRHSPSSWYKPRWAERWFPDAFGGTMNQLMRAIDDGSEPEISGRDHLKTLALVEAAYRSAAEHRAVELSEVLAEIEPP